MLTAKQEKFAQCIALEDMTYTDAYKTAYNAENMSNKTVNEQACVLAKDPKISARIDELRAVAMSDKVMSARERLEWLTRVVKDEEMENKVVIDDNGNAIQVKVKPNLGQKMGAIDTMNKMTGEYTTKIEADVKVKKLEDLL